MDVVLGLVIGLCVGAAVGWLAAGSVRAHPVRADKPDEEAARRAAAVLRDWQQLMRYDGYSAGDDT